MSEWKGPFKCEKCGLVVMHPETFREEAHLNDSRIWCDGKFHPYDRRAPDPEKAALVAALRMAEEAIDTGQGYALGDVGEKDESMEAALDQIRALLRRIEGGEG